METGLRVFLGFFYSPSWADYDFIGLESLSGILGELSPDVRPIWSKTFMTIIYTHRERGREI